MNKVIAIDLGHECSPYDIGANGVVSEESIIDAVGKLVILGLRELGNTVIETRPNSCISVGNSLSQRYNKSDDNNVDWCISIHANASDGNGHGTEIFTMGGKEIPEARNILNNIVNIGGFTNRGIKDGSSLAMVKRPKAKAMLIEICFCDNIDDIDKYNLVGAQAIANAIISGLAGQTIQSTKYKIGWNKDTKGYWYSTDGTNYYKNCWKQIADSTNPSILNYYYFNSEGYMDVDKWIIDNNKWYYLDENGIMLQARDGKIAIWKWIDSDCYCIATDGSLYVSIVTYDGYSVNSDGAWDSKIARK